MTPNITARADKVLRLFEQKIIHDLMDCEVDPNREPVYFVKETKESLLTDLLALPEMQDEEYEYLNNKAELKRNDKREIRNKLRAELKAALRTYFGAES